TACRPWPPNWDGWACRWRRRPTGSPSTRPGPGPAGSGPTTTTAWPWPSACWRCGCRAWRSTTPAVPPRRSRISTGAWNCWAPGCASPDPAGPVPAGGRSGDDGRTAAPASAQRLGQVGASDAGVEGVVQAGRQQVGGLLDVPVELLGRRHQVTEGWTQYLVD